MLDEVRRRLEDRDVDAEVAALALAAVRGGDHLDAVLAGAPDGPDATAADDGTAAGSPDLTGPAAHLSRIRVRGFRGIGPEATLDLDPGPGLTLVVGRNGSGKSSFAEAAEFALTGTNARWDTRSRVWRDGWRNLHHPTDATVTVEVVVDGQKGAIVAERRWRDDAKLEDATFSVRRPTGTTSLAELGWDVGLELYRPFLPYSELGAMIDEGPSSLHDALAAVLGLDQMTAATKRLRDARLTRERSWKEAAAAGRALADELADVEDDRAGRAAAQLTARQPSFAVLDDLAAGTSAPDRSLDLLRQLAAVRGPDLDAVRRVASTLDDALAAADDHLGSDAARDLEVAGLLATARTFHAGHGDGDCPVCGAGRLDAAWAGAAERRERELRAAAAEVQRAERALATALRQVRDLTGPAPRLLERGGAVGVEVAGALRAYEAWAAVSRTPDRRQQASALRTAADDLTAALTGVREQATALFQAREDTWRPYALRLASWLDRARPAHASTASVAPLQVAEKTLRDVLDELRTQRWRPIADAARDVWGSLRQRSNVSVDDVLLTGSGSRRRVEVQVTVDGVEGAALGVMSQGELHALALSLFLPRATLPESPFRFVVLDDPVQSMDPARVDGLARVLDATALERQVVVFTHDDRLPEAVRRLGITARVVEVTRGPASQVSVRETAAPWRRHLDDAWALARSADVPDLVRRSAVPTFCRMGLEAAAGDRHRRRAIADGIDRATVDADLADAATLLPLLALGLFGTSRRAGEVYGHLNRIGGWAADAVRACNEGSHGGFAGDVVALVKDVEDVVTKALT